MRLFRGYNSRSAVAFALGVAFLGSASVAVGSGNSPEVVEAYKELDNFQIHPSPITQKTLIKAREYGDYGTYLSMRRYAVPKSSLTVPQELFFSSYKMKNILLVGAGSSESYKGMRDLGFRSIVSTDLYSHSRDQYQADVLQLSDDLARYPQIPKTYALVLGHSLLCCLAKESKIQQAFVSTVLVLQVSGRARFAQAPCFFSGTGSDQPGRYKFLKRLESALKGAQKILAAKHQISTEIHLSTDFENGSYGKGLAEIIRLN